MHKNNLGSPNSRRLQRATGAQNPEQVKREFDPGLEGFKGDTRKGDGEKLTESQDQAASGGRFSRSPLRVSPLKPSIWPAAKGGA